MQPNPQRFACGSVLGKFTSVKVMSGMPRLMWFRKLTKETSTFSLARSVRLKLFDMAKSQLMVPGPSRMPTPEVPKRPMGGGVVPPEPREHCAKSPGAPPGHTKPAERNHCLEFCAPGYAVP